jgi:hypothetical protein
VGFGKGCFFGLGCFSLAVCVWEEGLRHTVIMDAMLGSVGVSVEACWRFYSCVTCLVFLLDAYTDSSSGTVG